MPGQDFLIIATSGIVVVSMTVWLIWLWQDVQ
jgi:hypothetical protein